MICLKNFQIFLIIYGLVHFIQLNLIECCDIRRQKLLVFLFDGFRHDYEKLHKLDNFEKIRHKGAFGVLKPVFPSMSAPNYYSPLTGNIYIC